METGEATTEFVRLMEVMPNGSPQKVLGLFSKGELFLLNYLYAHNGLARPGEMSSALGISTARVAAALKSMERKMWLVREADPFDLRKTIVRITPAGKKYIGGFRQKVAAILNSVFGELGEKDTGEFLRISKRVSEITTRLQNENPSLFALPRIK